MLRITTEATHDGFIIKLEGKLAGAWVDEVEQTRRAITGDTPDKSVLVDLCGVTFIDAEGKRLLRSMCTEGAQFRCCGPDISATVEALKREVLSELSAHARLW